MSEPLDTVRTPANMRMFLVLMRLTGTNVQGYVTYTIYVLLGAGLLFPWNAFITAADYFEQEFPVRL